MENNKETAYKGFVLNGFLALILVIALIAAIVFPIKDEQEVAEHE